MNDYEKAKLFWNQIFDPNLSYDPTESISIPEIENALTYLSQNCEHILDFGCGYGKILLRCLSKGTKDGYGVDLSQNAVDIGNKISQKYHLDGKFLSGGIEQLTHFKSNQFDGVILFNILDNLTIQDGKQLIKEIHRLTNTNGTLLLKLNPYLSEEDIKSNQLKPLEDEVYVDTNGLYLWNINEQRLHALFFNQFFIEKEVEINLGRIYYLRKIN